MQKSYPLFHFIFPNMYKEIDGRRYSFCGEFPKNKKLIEDIKHLMFKHGYYLKFQRVDSDKVVVWKRPR